MKDCIITFVKGYLKLLLICLIFILSVNTSFSQAKYKIYAGFINHFTKYVQWPANTKTGDFVIAIVGDCPIATDLQPLSGKTVGSQSIVVKTFKKASEITAAHIIFLPEQSKSAAAEVDKIAKTMNALFVTEFDGGAKKGADINFVEIEGKLKFEISNANNEAHGLKVAAELKKLGIVLD
ncbi:MAG: YfiR family protein [Cytophagales bacterium]